MSPRLRRIDRGLEVRVRAPARAHRARRTLRRGGEKHRGRERPHGKPEEVHVTVSCRLKSRECPGPTASRGFPGARRLLARPLPRARAVRLY